MNFLKRHLTAAASILVGAVVTVLYGTILSHLLVYMEQHRLFRFTGEYVATELHQAGAAKLAGDFVAQFFYHPWLGAVLLGLLFALLFAMGADGLRRLAGRANALTVGAGLVLPAILLAQGGTIEARIEPLMVSLVWAAAFWVVCLAGGLVLGRRRSKAAKAAEGAGVPARRVKKEPSPVRGPGRAIVASLATAVVILAGAVAWNLSKSYDPMERTVVLIEEEYRAGDDAAVISRADEYLAAGGRVHVVPFFRNMSLLRTGRLAAHAFDYPPLFGIRALYVPWDGHVLKREYGRYLFDLIGHVNEAQRLQSEAMTNFGETGRNIVDLTAYNIINGRDRVARRGIRHLRQSLFYRQQADSLEAALGTGRVAGRRNFFENLPDSLNRFAFDNLLQELGYMNQIREGDPMLQELFLVATLLQGDINNFVNGLNVFGMRDPEQMPVLYREALAMIQAHDPNGWWREAGIKMSVNDVERYGRFFKAMQCGNKMQLKSGFGGTYWYYFNFINPDRPKK